MGAIRTMSSVGSTLDRSTCVYCEAPATTSDHIPPRAVFPNRVGAVTVPACAACNNGASADDEYFAIVLSRRDREGKQPTDAAEVTRRMQRALDRPQAHRLRTSIENETFLARPQTPAGLVLPVESWTRVNVERCERVLARIVRGIYWQRTGERLPRELRVCAYPWEQLTVEQMRELTSYDTGKWDHGQLGTKVFAYRVSRFEPFGPHGTL
jgi:hypothetical protein